MEKCNQIGGKKVAIKKSELYSTLWESCNTLRSKGSMDATQYKDYVLIILFVKVITDKYYGKKDAIIYVPEEANFNTMISLKNEEKNQNKSQKSQKENKKELGKQLNEIIKQIAEENRLAGVIDIVDFNDEKKLGKGKDKIDALTGLIELFENPELNFKNNRAADDDLLGDAYEYLMKQFATEAGKSKGQFYTPAEVSRVMAKLIGINRANKTPISVYDMTCGSGSLLLKACAEAKDDIAVDAYGQEKDGSTAGLAIMNMYLHGNKSAHIKVGNTLTNPQFLLNKQIREFDYCVANPPFSIKKWNTDMENDYGRFEKYGMPPEGSGDYAFLLHMIKSMNPENGRGAIILPHGVLFRGGQEHSIRRALIEAGMIEGIIGLPANLFYGTGIPACIIILDMKELKRRKDIFMIDASKEFIKDGNKNRLREQDIRKIVDIYLERKKIDKYSRKVSIADIKKEDYNLNIPRYINTDEEDEKQDILSHLIGGIPEEDINKYKKFWKIAPNLKNKLFKNSKREGYFNIPIKNNDIFNEIENSEELNNYDKKVNEKINKWIKYNKDSFTKINKNTKVEDLIERVSLSILEIFKRDELLNNYDIYEYLMNYYNETMKDDIYLIVDDGWIPKIKYKKDKNEKERKDVFDSDLLPKEIVIKEYYKKEDEEIKKLNADLEEIINNYNTIIEENTGEELLFKEDEKISEKFIKAWIKETNNKEQIIILEKVLDNLNKQKEHKNKIKGLQEDLNKKIIEKYSTMNVNEAKKLIIDKKWFANIIELINEKLIDLKYELSSEILKEVKKYEDTLADLENKVKEATKKVEEDLKRMGFKW